MKLLKIFTVVAAAMILGLILTGPACADDFICDSLNYNKTFDNVIAEFGCNLQNSTVTGNVKVEEYGSLTAINTEVFGNVQAYGAVWVSLYSSDVDGDVQIKNTKEIIRVLDTDEGGNLQVEDNEETYYYGSATWIALDRNYVGGDLQANKNTKKFLSIDDNNIGGNLQCDDNNPPPDGLGNAAGGNKDGQCSGL
jgi:hypothetical protein